MADEDGTALVKRSTTGTGKQINQNLGIVSARALQIRKNIQEGVVRRLTVEKDGTSSSQGIQKGPDGHLNGKLEVVEVERSAETSRKLLNAAIVAKILEKPRRVGG